MRYVRTKDGKILKNGIEERKLGIRSGKGYEILINDINKSREADTIEELCDQFVMFDENNTFLIANENFSVIKDLWNRRDIVVSVYGEIWFNNELRKVAKMNKKGEFELL